MSKLNFLIIGSAMGLLCASSPAALAQSAPPGGSKTNVSETKFPFKIPNSGSFRYNGKPSQGDFLQMEVKWQAAGMQPNTDKIRIGGDVKYKNPKTGMMDVRTINGDKSYITKSGELFFALNDVDGKVYGPVGLVELEAKRSESKKLEKTDKKTESKSNVPSAEGMKAPSLGEKSAKSVNNASKSLSEGPKASLDEVSSDLQSSESESLSSANNGSKPNDIFKTAGEFAVGRSVIIKWRQAARINGNYYPAGSKAVSFDLYKDGKYQSGWEHKWPSYLDKDGFVHIKTRGPKDGFSRNFKSNQSFLSDKYKTLVKAIDQIKKEEKFVKDNSKNGKDGLKFLSSAIKDEGGNVLGTEGTILLNAVILATGAYNVAHKKTPLSTKVFDNVNRLLDQKEMGWLVHRVADRSGLSVSRHPTRGRNLMEKQCSSSSSQGTCPNTSSTPLQHNDIRSLTRAAPLPEQLLINQAARLRFCPLRITDADIWDLEREINTMVANSDRDENPTRETTAYGIELARYVANQRFFYDNPSNVNINTLGNLITALLTRAWQVRMGEMDLGAFTGFRRMVENDLRFAGNLNVPRTDFVNFILQIPGFQRTPNGLRTELRTAVILQMHRNLAVTNLGVRYNLPDEVRELIRGFARILIFSNIHRFGGCNK